MANSSKFPAVEDYQEEDFGRDGAAGKALMARIEDEVDHESLTLTAVGDSGAWAAGLTPAMNEWLNSDVVALRTQAINEVEQAARAVKIAPKVDGILTEVELDRVERQRMYRTAELVENFNRDNKDALEDLREKDDEYQLMKAEEGGREAKLPNHFIEWGILLPGILIPEALLNFESFRRAPIVNSDFMALGATVLVGIFIAVAAFAYGLFIRRLNYYSRADDQQRNASGWPLMVFGSVLLTLALISVAAARYYYLLPLLEEAILSGGRPPNLYMSIAALLAGNLGCFFAGVIFTFLRHDPNPDFADRAMALRKAKTKVENLMSRALRRQLSELDRRAKDDREQIDRKARQMQGKAGYADMRKAVGAISAHDNKVVALLQRYRSELVKALRASGREVQVQQRDVSADLSNPNRIITLADFNALPINLHWGQGQ